MKKYFLILLQFLLVSVVFAEIPSAPSISAKSYILLEHETGKILESKEEEKKLSPASLTKIMTAYVVFKEIKDGRLNLEEEISISKKAWKTQGSKTYVEVGKKVKVNDLIKGMIIQSGNDASVALAEHISGTEKQFSQLMNFYAKKIGMKNSNFSNATGLPIENHYTTAMDLAILTRALIKEFPELYDIYSYKQFTFNDITQKTRNRLLFQDENFDGVKTGFTNDAGYCFVGSARRNDRRLISVILGAKNPKTRFEDTKSLINHGFTFYETHRLFEQDEYIPQLTTKVFQGNKKEIKIGVKEDLLLTLKKGEVEKLKFKVDIVEKIIAPLEIGAKLGSIKIVNDNKILAETDLVSLEDVKEGNVLEVVIDILKLKFNS